VTFLEEYLREAKELRLSLFGLAVIGIVLFLPRGMMGFVMQRRERMERKKTASAMALKAKSGRPA